MTSAPGLFAEAVARGLVSAREVLSGRVSVTDQSRSNVVNRVDVDDRPVAYVKVAGPAAAWDAVAAHTPVERAELVGLVPQAVLAATPRARWAELDLAPDRTIEARLAAAGR